MRVGVLVSLLVHGAAAAALALLGLAGGAPDHVPPLAVSIRSDAAPAPEPLPDEPALRDAPPPAESWAFPAEEPTPPAIDAPEIPGPEPFPVPRAILLARPLSPPAPEPPPPPLAALAAPQPPPLPRAARSGEVRAPRLLPRSREARYPTRARRLGLEGTVILRLLVAADGTVARVEIVKSSGHGILDRAAADAARTLWRFEPARRDGVAVAGEIRVPVEFRLADA